MKLYRFAVFLMIFLFVFLISVNLYKYYKLKSENESLRKTYESLNREYIELRNLENRLQEMKKGGEVRGNNFP